MLKPGVPSRLIDAQAAIEQLWADHADDPERQALECAAWCVAHAPHLASGLKHRIQATLSDTLLAQLAFNQTDDGRIRAYTQLSQAVAPLPPPVRPAVPIRKTGQGAEEKKRTAPDFAATYQEIFGVKPQIVPELPAELRTEPEIGRICIGLYKASEYRLYVVARELTRSSDGSGKVSKKALRAALRAYGITYTREHFNRLLRAGKGLFWNLSRRQVFIRRLAWLSSRLAELAPELYATNRPGVRDMYVSPAGTHEQWEAMLYAAWCAHRENPTIARETLETLFNRTQHTLRRWEQAQLQGFLTIRANVVQCPHPLHEDERYAGDIPEHSYPYVARVKFQGQWQEVVRIRWRTSNTYQTSGIRQHPKRGQARKVRKAVNGMFEQPADGKRCGPHPLKRYFDNAKHLKDYTAKKLCIAYLWRGENWLGQGVFEINTTGFWFTWPNERVSASEERLVLMTR